jgi:hypothetical protein
VYWSTEDSNFPKKWTSVKPRRNTMPLNDDEKQAQLDEALVSFVRTAKDNPVIQKTRALLGELGQEANAEKLLQKAQLEAFLNTEAGQAFLATVEAQGFLDTDEGRAYLMTPRGLAFLITPSGEAFLASPKGQAFLENPQVKAFIASPEVRAFVTQAKELLPGPHQPSHAKIAAALADNELANLGAEIAGPAPRTTLPDLNLPQDLVVFMGILGDSPTKGAAYQRLYLTIQLNEYIEFPVSKLVCVLDTFGTTMQTAIIWLRRDATIEHHAMETVDLQRGFLQGSVLGSYNSQPLAPRQGMTAMTGGGSAFCTTGGGSAFCTAGGGSAFCIPG